MRSTRTLLLALVCALSLPAARPAALRAQGEKKLDITGKWSFTVESPAGTGTPTVTFTQKGDTISGRYSSQALGEHDFTGTLKAGKIEFGFPAESGGQQFIMSFSGTVDGPDSMKGALDFSGLATGAFAGKRQKP